MKPSDLTFIDGQQGDYICVGPHESGYIIVGSHDHETQKQDDVTPCALTREQALKLATLLLKLCGD